MRSRLNSIILNYRNGLFDKVIAENAIQAIISFGNGADLAINDWQARPVAIPWFQLLTLRRDDNIVLPNWNATLNNLGAAVAPDKLSSGESDPYGAISARRVADIPREDLPFAIADWHGTGGETRSQRNGNNIIDWTSPLSTSCGLL